MASFRVPEQLWKRFGELAMEAGTTRTALLLAYVRWYVGEPDSHMPRRPTRKP
jgi:hypothetical protein